MKTTGKWLGLLLALALAMPAQAERVKDLATIHGVRNNQLVGYGLVVGLDGTGDQTTQTPFTVQSIASMLRNMGINLPAGTNLQLKNVAAVMVTANLPPFAKPGQALDVTDGVVAHAAKLLRMQRTTLVEKLRKYGLQNGLAA